MGWPTKEQLEHIIAATGPKLYAMRSEMNLKPLSFLVIGDLISSLRKAAEDEPTRFSIMYPYIKMPYLKDTAVFEGSLASTTDRTQLQHRVEQHLGKHKRCALSLWFNHHIITGCFDKEVRSQASCCICSITVVHHLRTEKKIVVHRFPAQPNLVWTWSTFYTRRFPNVKLVQSKRNPTWTLGGASNYPKRRGYFKNWWFYEVFTLVRIGKNAYK
jgi:hypothetical protein